MNFSDALKVDFSPEPLCCRSPGLHCSFESTFTGRGAERTHTHTHTSTSLVTPASLLSASIAAAAFCRLPPQPLRSPPLPRGVGG